MKKCNCYHVRKQRRYLTDFERGYYYASGIRKDFVDEEVAECWGTREQDPCGCGGDRIKCSFYEDVRKEAQDEQRKLNKNSKNSTTCPVCGKKFENSADYNYCPWCGSKIKGNI